MKAIPRTHQFTCVVNKKKNPAVIMNAIGHMTAGLVKQYKNDTSLMRFRDFIDKDKTVHPSTSENGFIILRSDNSNQLRTLRNALIEQDTTGRKLENDKASGRSSNGPRRRNRREAADPPARAEGEETSSTKAAVSCLSSPRFVRQE